MIISQWLAVGVCLWDQDGVSMFICCRFWGRCDLYIANGNQCGMTVLICVRVVVGISFGNQDWIAKSVCDWDI